MNAVCHEQFKLGSHFGKKVTAGFDGGSISADGGCLLLRELDLRSHVFALMTSSLQDHRAANRVHHGLEKLLN